MNTTANPKRRGHRRGQPVPLAPTGNRRAHAALQRQCCMCRAQKPPQLLLQLGAMAEGGEGAPKRGQGRHSYVCLTAPCLRAAAKRMAPKKTAPHDASAAFLTPIVQLATTRLVETIGLARRQGVLVMGASRLVALRPKDADLYVEDDDDDDGYDDDDEDDDEDEDDIDSAGDQQGVAVVRPRSHVASTGEPKDTPIETAFGEDSLAAADISAIPEPSGAQDVVLLAADAAQRTARRLGATALPCMLCGADMGRAAGGASVAAVGIPAGRLALQAAYWLQVWYEARTVLTTPESMMN